MGRSVGRSVCRSIYLSIKKANQTLGLQKIYIRVHNKDLKSVAYKTLVRPKLVYASTVWSPHTTTNIHNQNRYSGKQPDGLLKITATPQMLLQCYRT